ncbi:TetR/AcrR family transcriptional regulator [Agromyces badenianii]|uniref:TetR/AcrR family transcriptional regulator n=1 Tax=Agromyces badenianii TaxID=2080742 RepID=A0A2S0WVK1_9MICO|nr:TetR/AcrR family transcriptional regulator [Agromyces badenianii]AWB95342.1 TetR/AcrR family transcriptional regulator [Agromyces badenianii]PWC04383.1 TetR/AcrR family transcriptional regulator [Agromyces badenianii]
MPNVDLILGADPSRRRSIRTEPTQRRSTQRLDALLDAAAEIVDESGFERLTTQMVAERAGASIGTVYRYFPDRVAVLHALRERSVRRYRERVADDMERAELDSWWRIIDVALDACAAMYRDEPGFSVVHAARRETPDDDIEPELAHRLARLIDDEFGADRDQAELRFRLGIAMELGDALISRAFERDEAGDDRYLAETKRLVHDYLAEFLGDARATSNAA